MGVSIFTDYCHISKNKTEICILGYYNVFKMSFYSFELCGSVPLKKNKKRNSTDREKRISSIIIQKRPKIPCLLNNKRKIGLYRRSLATNICKTRLPSWI